MAPRMKIESAQPVPEAQSQGKQASGQQGNVSAATISTATTAAPKAEKPAKSSIKPKIEAPAASAAAPKAEAPTPSVVAPKVEAQANSKVAPKVKAPASSAAAPKVTAKIETPTAPIVEASAATAGQEAREEQGQPSQAEASDNGSKRKSLSAAQRSASGWVKRTFPGREHAFYGAIIALLVALLVFAIGVWRVLFIGLLVFVGIAVGQLLDGDPKIISAIRDLFSSDREQ